MDKLAADHPTDSLMLWMVAVQCRALSKPLIGVERYAKLCEVWKPGPVLIHQTYANLLDQLKRHEEALPHRELAVKLEPAPWSYDGLGNTLLDLRQWDAAEAAYAQATHLAPGDAHSWNNWARCKEARGDVEGAKRCREKVEELKKAALEGE